MSTVLEEKMPMIHDYLIERYGQLSQSAVDAVAQGLKTAISMGIASSAQDKIANFGIQTLLGPDTAQSMLGPLIGTKISEAAGVASPEQLFQGQLKGLEKAQNAELTAFANNVFGDSGMLRSFETQGIAVSGGQNPTDQVNFQDTAVARGIIINGAESPQSESAIVGPEYTTLKAMEKTLRSMLKLQQDLQQFNIPVKA